MPVELLICMYKFCEKAKVTWRVILNDRWVVPVDLHEQTLSSKEGNIQWPTCRNGIYFPLKNRVISKYSHTNHKIGLDPFAVVECWSVSRSIGRNTLCLHQWSARAVSGVVHFTKQRVKIWHLKVSQVNMRIHDVVFHLNLDWLVHVWRSFKRKPLKDMMSNG